MGMFQQLSETQAISRAARLGFILCVGALGRIREGDNHTAGFASRTTSFTAQSRVANSPSVWPEDRNIPLSLRVIHAEWKYPLLIRNVR